MASRGALRAFHHQIGFAFRRLKHSSPAFASTLLPAIRSVQTGIDECAPQVARGGHAMWPPWRGKKRSRQQQQQQPQQLSTDSTTVLFPNGSLGQLGMVWSSRALKQHNTDETGVPQEEDDEVISLTETWDDSVVSVDACSKTRKHSRKPRVGRRAKARTHLERFYHEHARASIAAVNESSGLAPMGFLTALIEGMEQDVEEDHAGLPALGGSQSQDIQSDVDQTIMTPAATSEAEGAGADLAGTGGIEAFAMEPFEVKFLKRAGTSLGVAFNILWDGLLVTWVGEEGLVGMWNRGCDVELQVRSGDKVISSNGNYDPESMIEGFSRLGPHRLQVLRGPFDVEG